MTFEEREEKKQEQVDAITHEFHGQFINEEDFETYDEYLKFLDDYTSLRYEPLIIKFDEERFLTQEADKKFDSAWRYRLLTKGSPIKSISFK